jgi:NADH-quinone oxidoreductase subunit I
VGLAHAGALPGRSHPGDGQQRTRALRGLQLCEFICPPRAIFITPEEIPTDSKWAKVEKRPKEFDIDMIRCIYCGMCEEVCPEQAIFLRKDYAITGVTRAEMVHHKERLYELGGVFDGLVHKWNPLK